MSTTTHTVDKSGWPDGPWMTEPDKIQWTTAAGLPGLIVRNGMGALCGYVAVSPGHPWFEMNYDDVPVEVHGGLTYADHCQATGPVCHVPAPGEPDNVFWFGFDCCHSGDVTPSCLRYQSPAMARYEVYRDLAYVRVEVERLAAQLAAMTEAPTTHRRAPSECDGGIG